MKRISNTFPADKTLPVLDGWSLDMITAYSGSDRKEGLVSPEGHRYLVKYAEAHTRVNDLDTSYVNNVISEYVASHILGIVGFEVHDTFIGTRNQNLLVACRNFTSGHQYLIEFGHTVNGRKASYLDMLSSGFVPSLDKAVRKVVPVILDQMPAIREFIDMQEFLSDTRKVFYKTMLDARAEYILKPAYECSVSGNYDADALDRLQNGIEYTEKDFESLCAGTGHPAGN